jgi:transmembrane sensor
LKPSFDWELFLKYLEGITTSDEEKALNIWRAASKDNSIYFDHIQKIWETSDDPLPQPDLVQAWKTIEDKAGIIEQDIKNVHSFDSQERFTIITRKIFRSRILQAAAVLLIMLMIPYLIWKPFKSPKMSEIRVGNGQLENITLTDGTDIILDAGTIFRIPEQFYNNTREVYLNGEGYFKVTSDANRPFVIHTNDAIITVLGTEFNVRAWQQNKHVTVAVVEGKVVLSAANKEGRDTEVCVNKNQISVMQGDENPSLPQHADLKWYLSWKQREMYFQRTPLWEVLQQLERWYDVDFQLHDEKSATNLVTIFIKNDPIADIIDVIALMNDFQYRQEGRKILFFPKE